MLEMGSSAVGVGAGDVLVFNPGVVTDTNAEPLPAVSTGVNGFRCSDQRAASGNAAQGVIASRAEELAGPQSADGTGNLAGYVPCTYVAPATGIYGVVYYGPSGDGSAADGGPTGEIDLTSAANLGAAKGTSVAAWDLTVRSSASSTSDLDGRLYTTALIAFTGGNARPINVSVDVVTLPAISPTPAASIPTGSPSTVTRKASTTATGRRRSITTHWGRRAAAS